MFRRPTFYDVCRLWIYVGKLFQAFFFCFIIQWNCLHPGTWSCMCWKIIAIKNFITATVKLREQLLFRNVYTYIPIYIYCFHSNNVISEVISFNVVEEFIRRCIRPRNFYRYSVKIDFYQFLMLTFRSVGIATEEKYPPLITICQ